MKSFMCDDFLLSNEIARTLYHDYAAQMPIFDYHCHLSPKEIAQDRCFENLTQISLDGDHYKWRALRTAGVLERLITGSASDREKFDAWAAFMPKAIGNPLYHWAHLELKRPFGIQNTLINPENADKVWSETCELLKSPEFSARGILNQMQVAFVGTTDDPADSLEYHQKLSQEPSFKTQVSPSFRPDRAFKIEDEHFAAYLDKLGRSADLEITDWQSLIQALTHRLDVFDSLGCRSADHGIEVVRFEPIPGEIDLNRFINKKRGGHPLSDKEVAAYSTAVQVWLAGEYCKRGWVMQLHIGALRNNNSRMFRTLGRDAGFDSMGDHNFAQPLAKLLDKMDSEGGLPKTVLYTLNPSANEMLATMAGNFQDGVTPGKIQFGSAWWFNDQKDGMNRQIEQLAQLGLLSHFVGMLTDSRSLLSFSRHEYFRRILCEKVGQWVVNGEAPNDLKLLGNMIQDICFHNANTYFGGGSKRN